MFEITVEGSIVEGASIVNVSDNDIPDDIMELKELGLYTEDEVKAKCAVGGSSREKRLIIRKPSITYIGEGETRTPTVASDKKKYKESDKVFFAQFLANLTPNKEDVDTSAKSDEEKHR